MYPVLPHTTTRGKPVAGYGRLWEPRRFFLLAIHNRATVALKSSGGRLLIINYTDPTITPADIFTPAGRRRPTLAGRTNMNYLTFAPLKWEPRYFLKIQ